MGSAGLTAGSDPPGSQSPRQKGSKMHLTIFAPGFTRREYVEWPQFLAQEAGLSLRNLSRLFLHQVGLSPQTSAGCITASGAAARDLLTDWAAQ